MLSKQQVLILFLLCAIPFLFYFTLRIDLIGADTYYFLNQACGIDTSPLIAPVGFQLIFSLIPCNILAIKTILFFLLLSSTLLVAMLGTVFNKEHGWLAGAFCFLTPLWITKFMNFEDDQFALPLLFLALLVFAIGVKEKNWKKQLLGFALLLPASLIWNGSVFYIFAFAANLFIPAILVSIPIITVFYKNILAGIWPLRTTAVLESTPFVAIGFLGFLNVGFFNLERKLLGMTIFLTLIAILAMKWTVLLVPLLALGLVHVFQNAKPKGKTFFKIIVLFWPLLMFTALPEQMPNLAQTQGIDFAVMASQDYNFPIVNDWGMGYWVEWRGARPSNKGFAHSQDYRGLQDVILVTDFNKRCNGGVLLDVFETADYKTRVWKC